LNIKIHRVGKDLLTIIDGYGGFLPSNRARYCTREAKIEPFINWIGKAPCTVYYGIRADEQRAGFNNNSTPWIQPSYPLIDFKIDLSGVYLILKRFNLKPPAFFWEDIFNKVKNSLGYDPQKVISECDHDILFAWRSRANCDRCFNQRYYEWVGLFEHYPHLFWDAERMEHTGSKGTFTWSREISLKEIINNKEEIKEKRVGFICKAIERKTQVEMFPDQAIDMLDVTSCGLFCGK